MAIACTLWLSSFVVLTFQGARPVIKDMRRNKRNSRQDITVRGDELKPCSGNDHVCVTDSHGCVTRPSLLQDTVKNISCFFQLHDESVTCSWIPVNNFDGDTQYVLIFSGASKIDHCPFIFNLAAIFDITVKATNTRKRTVSLSDPYTMNFFTAVKPSQPVIRSISTTKDSMRVMWTTGMSSFKFNMKCKIHYRLTTTDQWNQILDNTTVDSSGVYVIEGLQSFRNYSVAVSCIGDYGHWSDWSLEKLGSTLERAPSKALDVCQRVETLDSEGHRKLWLMWKPLNDSDAHGTVLGYRVHYMPADDPTLSRTVNTTDLGTSLVLTDSEYEVMAMAYNSAGGSPYARLRVPSGIHQDLPSVRRLWASLKDGDLWVQWEVESTPVPVSEFAIEWATDGDPRGSRWQRVGPTSSKTVLQGNVQPLNRYNVTVYPIYGTMCGPPKSVQASLEDEEAAETGKLHIVNLAKHTATVRWEWPGKRQRDHFLRCIVTLTHSHEIQSFEVGLDEQQHTFLGLTPNTEYSVYVTGETISGNSTSESFVFTTLLFGEEDVATAVTPIVLLLLLVVVVLILSRTVYKDYFFPQIPNPSVSLVGQWLLESTPQSPDIRHVLKLEEFLATDILTGSCGVQVEPWALPLGNECKENAFLPGNSDYVENVPPDADESTEETLPSRSAQHVQTVPPADNSEYVKTGCFFPEQLT